MQCSQLLLAWFGGIQAMHTMTFRHREIRQILSLREEFNEDLAMNFDGLCSYAFCLHYKVLMSLCLSAAAPTFRGCFLLFAVFWFLHQHLFINAFFIIPFYRKYRLSHFLQIFQSCITLFHSRDSDHPRFHISSVSQDMHSSMLWDYLHIVWYSSGHCKAGEFETTFNSLFFHFSRRRCR